MTTYEFYDDLRRRQVHLIHDSGTLRWRAPEGALTVADVLQIKAEKADLLRLIADRNAADLARWGTDPRPDIEVDSRDWTHLLRTAFLGDGDDPNGVFGILHGLRCWGAALVTDRARVRIDRGEIAQDDYRRWRERYLLPHAAAIAALLATVPVEEEAVGD
jgi:hypothetical protein